MPDLAPKHITIVGPLPPPFGGMANQTRQLAMLLEKEGIHVDIVQTNAPYKPEWIKHYKGLRALFRLLPYLITLFAKLKQTGVAHVMANSGLSWYLFAGPAIGVARLVNVPVVVNYRGGEAGSFFAKSIRWVRPILNLADAIVVPSPYLQCIFRNFGIDTDIVPNIVNLDRFKAKSNKEPNFTAPHLISCRNLEMIYDIETTLKAFKEIQRVVCDARLSVAGEGPEKKKLQAFAKELGIDSSVTFTGRLDPDGMAGLYQSADLMINTSRVDNMPNALLEAMAVGVPIVTTDAGGIPYIVQDNINGFLVPIGDWKKVSEAVRTLLNDNNLYSRIRENARSSIENCSWILVKSAWIEVYKKLLEAGR